MTFLGWIRIRIQGTMPLTNGPGSGSCYFRHWPSRWQQKKKFFIVLLLITFWNIKLSSLESMWIIPIQWLFSHTQGWFRTQRTECVSVRKGEHGNRALNRHWNIGIWIYSLERVVHTDCLEKRWSSIQVGVYCSQLYNVLYNVMYTRCATAATATSTRVA